LLLAAKSKILQLHILILVQLLEQLQVAEQLVVLQALHQEAIGTVTVVVQDATITYAVAIVIIAGLAFVFLAQLAAVIALYMQALAQPYPQVIKATIAVMQDMQAADLQALGFTVRAALAKMRLILLQYGV
jgi:hypothetical protein